MGCNGVRRVKDHIGNYRLVGGLQDTLRGVCTAILILTMYNWLNLSCEITLPEDLGEVCAQYELFGHTLRAGIASG
jgi:hypothetical protein